MLHKEFWGLVFLAFVVWVFVAGTPQSRIENACRPIGWVGNATTSMAALTFPAHQAAAQRWFDKFEYGCRFMIWRLFYQDAYNKWLASQTQGAAPPGATPTPGATPAPETTPAPEPSGETAPGEAGAAQ